MPIDGKLSGVSPTASESQRSDTVCRRGQLRACVGRQAVTSTRRRRVRRLAVSTGLLLTVAILAGLPVYVRPQVDQLRRADAILVLGGYGEARYDLGLDLKAQGWAPAIVLSNPIGPDHPETTNLCVTPHPKLQLHCFVPDPPTTKGEAKELRRLAEQYKWRTVIVVTF